MKLLEFPVKGWGGRNVSFNAKDVVWIAHGIDIDRRNGIDTTSIRLCTGDTFCLATPYDSVKRIIEEVAGATGEETPF